MYSRRPCKTEGEGLHVAPPGYYVEKVDIEGCLLKLKMVAYDFMMIAYNIAALPRV